MHRAILILCLLSPAFCPAQEPSKYDPPIAAASNEAKLAIARFQVPEGFVVKLAAAEPLLANPVAFCVDPQGRVYVCETFRQQKGVEDNRYHMGWLHDDLAARTVEDRVRMFRKHLGEKAIEYTREHDRIRRLADVDGDGQYETSTVFADGFSGMAEGTGAGVLFWRGSVYYTCIPRLWRLVDEDDDGVADVREPLADGFGVRVAFRGHDMHGLTVGPDGRIYFSIGDRGYNVRTREGQSLVRPDAGAVFRCEPDGSHLEVFAYGFRNPQELAFDDYGNLFTGDNNSDSGDKARWVCVVEGADIGWRMYYQYLEDRGPWNRERMWYPYRADELTTAIQPASILPPIANLADGPSGLTYYPGVGLSDRYRGHFFLADFRGTAGNSGIRSFAVKPRGATFELTDSHQFIWSVLATDVDFDNDGSLLVTDWVNGWEGEGKGRLYRFEDSKHASAGKRSAELLRSDFGARATEQLVSLLDHADRRVRQQAQFALARPDNLRLLGELAKNSPQPFPRIHAIWALGQLGRQTPTPAIALLLPLAADEDAEIRAQCLRTLNDICGRGCPDSMRLAVRSACVQGMNDKALRVRSFAALALAKVGTADDIAAVVRLLAENDDADPVVRHAGVMALAGLAKGSAGRLAEAVRGASVPVRRAAVVALRRLRAPELEVFLRDADGSVALEAARAINDDGLDELQPALANLIDDPGLSSALLRRAMNAGFRLGQREHAAAIAAVAASDQQPEAVRLEAIHELEAWNEPPPLDRVDGRWRPIEARNVAGLADAVRPALGGILASESAAVRDAGVRLASVYGIRDVAPTLHRLLADNNESESTREAALRALDAIEADQLSGAVELALTSDSEALRSAAREIVLRREPERGEALMIATLESGAPREQQVSIRALANRRTPAATAALLRHFDRVLNGTAAPETTLEILDAARQQGSEPFAARLAQFEARRDAGDPLAQYREALAGGDAKRGRDIFFGRSVASCRRCHKVGTEGGAVGPELTTIAKDRDRLYLLESIVLPNRKIAKGFETVVVVLDNGKTYSGIVKDQDEQTLTLMDPNGATIVLRKDEIEDQAPGQSGMPADLIKHLTVSDLRDLVEYLARQK